MRLDLLPRKEFSLTLEDGTIVKGQFTLWASKRFSDKKGLTLRKLADALNEENQTFDDLVQVILCAVESKQREEGVPFKYSDFEVCNWIEQMGGLMGEQFNKLLNHAGSEQAEEKKNLNQSNGESLKESFIQPV